MKKRSIFVIAIIAILTLGLLSSCSSSDEPQYSDKAFMKSLAKGLEARWDISEKDENTVESFKNCIQAELDQVEQYQSATFEDSVLQEKALAYINVLKDSMENVEYAVSSTEPEKWTDLYDKRTMMIKDFVDNYGLTVGSKYQDTLDELVANGKTAGVKAEQKESVEQLVSKLDFELKEDDYGYKRYEAILENTTEYDLSNLSLEISLLDKDGVIVETAYASADNVSKGQKARVEFSTDKDFDKYEIVLDYFEAK